MEVGTHRLISAVEDHGLEVTQGSLELLLLVQRHTAVEESWAELRTASDGIVEVHDCLVILAQLKQGEAQTVECPGGLAVGEIGEGRLELLDRIFVSSHADEQHAVVVVDPAVVLGGEADGLLEGVLGIWKRVACHIGQAQSLPGQRILRVVLGGLSQLKHSPRGVVLAQVCGAQVGPGFGLLDLLLGHTATEQEAEQEDAVHRMSPMSGASACLRSSEMASAGVSRAPLSAAWWGAGPGCAAISGTASAMTRWARATLARSTATT